MLPLRPCAVRPAHFPERITAASPWARLTARLGEIVHHLGLALGGHSAASFAQRLRLPVSNDTLLRVVRRRGAPAFVPPQAIGIDDWAWKRDHRYGTLICDLERRRTIALLPDHEPATAQAWLSGQPQIEVVTRDRGGVYAHAAARALPGAIQVADRWRLIENASQALRGRARWRRISHGWTHDGPPALATVPHSGGNSAISAFAARCPRTRSCAYQNT